jgi:hypothetical protein
MKHQETMVKHAHIVGSYIIQAKDVQLMAGHATDAE